MPVKFTYEFVRSFIDIESGSGCKLLSKEYENSKAKLSIQCKCGRVFSNSYSEFKHQDRRRCYWCGGNIRWTHETVKEYVEHESLSGCKLVSDKYIRIKEPMDFMCECGNIFTTPFDTFYSKGKHRCNECNYNKIDQRDNRMPIDSWRYEYKDIKNFVETETDCTLISTEYINSNTHLIFLCGRCGEPFERTFSRFKNVEDPMCNECRRKAIGKLKRVTEDDFLKELFDVHRDDYVLVGKYKKKTKKVRFKHVKCGYEWSVTPQNLVGNAGKTPTGCPRCSESQGERKVGMILDSMEVHHKKEYCFPDCASESLLKFDFYLPDSNQCIEYDGEHHFEPVDFAGKGQEWAENRLRGQQERDEIKSQYCKDNGIPLLRIPYWEFNNIEDILEEWLCN